MSDKQLANRQPNNQLANLQKVLVVQFPGVEVGLVEAAIAILQQEKPNLSLQRLLVKEDDGFNTSYVLPGEIPLSIHDNLPQVTIQWIREQQVDAGVMLTSQEHSFPDTQRESPYTWAYRCYLAGVPIRIGISQEFGGQVLSHCIAPPNPDIPNPYLYLFQTCGLLSKSSIASTINSSINSSIDSSAV